MEYYNIKDALAEGALIRVELLADKNDQNIQEIIKGKKSEDKKILLPYHMVECLTATSHVSIDKLVQKELEMEIEGAPDFCNLENTVIYTLIEKIEDNSIVSEDVRELVRAMHGRRVVKHSKELGEKGERHLSREEKEILRKGRAGWAC